jgi:hypothetical protein
MSATANAIVAGGGVADKATDSKAAVVRSSLSCSLSHSVSDSPALVQMQRFQCSKCDATDRCEASPLDPSNWNDVKCKSCDHPKGFHKLGPSQTPGTRNARPTD